MPLPTLPRSEYSVKNSFYPNKGRLTLMPFTVAQESTLLEIKDGTDKEKLQAVKQVIEGCVKEPINVAALPLFVLEELFLRLREKSIGELMELNINCDGKLPAKPATEEAPATPETKCDAKFPITINLQEIVLVTPEGHKNVIMMTDTIGVKLRYPTIDTFEDIDPTNAEQIFLTTIESVFDGDNVSMAEDETPEALKEFYKSMSFKNKADIVEAFFDKQPHLHYKNTFTCPKCGKDHELEFNSIRDFFL